MICEHIFVRSSLTSLTLYPILLGMKRIEDVHTAHARLTNIVERIKFRYTLPTKCKTITPHRFRSIQNRNTDAQSLNIFSSKSDDWHNFLSTNNTWQLHILCIDLNATKRVLVFFFIKIFQPILDVHNTFFTELIFGTESVLQILIDSKE